MDKPVCNRCGEVDPFAPCLLVPCPKCKARIGVRCGEKHPSGHKVVFGALPCVQREQAALEAGLMQKCQGPEVISSQPQKVDTIDPCQLSMLATS